VRQPSDIVGSPPYRRRCRRRAAFKGADQRELPVDMAFGWPMRRAEGLARLLLMEALIRRK